MSITPVRSFTSALARGLVVSALFAFALVVLPHAALAATTNTTMKAADASGTYSGTANLSATLTYFSFTDFKSHGVANKTVTFKLNGNTVGTAMTDSNGIATLNNASLSGITVGTYQHTGANTNGINASFAGDATYSSSNDYSKLTVSKGAQTITFDTLSDKTLGDADFSVSATASSNLTVAFASQTTSVCTVSGTTVHLVAQGTCTVRASQAGDSNWSAAANVDQSFTVSNITVPTTGTLTVTTSVVGGSATASSFPLTLDGMSITSGTATTTSSGSHAIAAGSVANYTATISGDCNTSGQVNIPAGGSASCTVTETYSAPVIPSGNLIANPSVETPDSGNLPASWTNDYYGDAPTFAYPVAGAPGAGSSAIEVTYGNTPTTESGAYWLFDLVNVAPGHTYFFTDKYKSDVVTTIEATFSYPIASAPSGCEAGGAPAGHCFVGQWFADAPATGGVWANLSTVEIPVPAGADAVRVRHILSAKGTLTTDAYSLTSTNPNALSHGFVTLSFDDGWKSQFNFAKPILDALHLPATFYIITGPLGSDLQAPGDGNPDNPDYMTLADITALKNDGMDIGAHTRSHPAGGLTATTTEGVTWEVNGSMQDLTDRGFTVNNFAYPEGVVNGSIETAVANAGFLGARGTDDGFNDLSTDHYDLKATEILSTTNIADIKALVDQAVSTNTWLVLFTHKIADTTCGAETGCMTKADLQDLANYIAGKETATPGTAITVSQGLSLLGATAPANQAPVLDAIANQTATVGTQLTFTAHATDANSDTLTYALTGSAPAGASITSAGAFTWTPTADQTGATTTTVTVSDGRGGTDSQVVNITVAAVSNAAPVAFDLPVSTSANTATTSTLTATDADAGDTLTFATSTNPSHGTLTLNSATGEFTYTPDASTTAFTDSFSFKANDGKTDSNTATVSISVGAAPAVNNAPVANAQSVTLDKNTSKDITITGTDADASDTLVFATSTNPAHGSLTGSGATYTYTPTTDYVGIDSFDFAVGDGHATTTATVSITVNNTSPNNGGGTSCTGCGCGGCGGGGGGGTVLGLIGTVNTNPTGGQVLGASTGGLSETQIDAILNLLRSFNADQSVIDNVSHALHGMPGSSTSGKFVFTKTLQVGSTGNEVTQLQSRLTLEGIYSGPITGYFGSLTKAAVIKYQGAHNLPQVGIVGPLTRAELNK